MRWNEFNQIFDLFVEHEIISNSILQNYASQVVEMIFKMDLLLREQLQCSSQVAKWRSGISALYNVFQLTCPGSLYDLHARNLFSSCYVNPNVAALIGSYDCTYVDNNRKPWKQTIPGHSINGRV